MEIKFIILYIYLCFLYGCLNDIKHDQTIGKNPVSSAYFNENVDSTWASLAYKFLKVCEEPKLHGSNHESIRLTLLEEGFEHEVYRIELINKNGFYYDSLIYKAGFLNMILVGNQYQYDTNNLGIVNINFTQQLFNQENSTKIIDRLNQYGFFNGKENDKMHKNSFRLPFIIETNLNGEYNVMYGWTPYEQKDTIILEIIRDLNELGRNNPVVREKLELEYEREKLEAQSRLKKAQSIP